MMNHKHITKAKPRARIQDKDMYKRWKWKLIEKSEGREAYGVVVRMVHTTWGVVATKMSKGLPLESLTLLKIRPSQEDSNLTNTSNDLCKVIFLFQNNM